MWTARALILVFTSTKLAFRYKIFENINLGLKLLGKYCEYHDKRNIKMFVIWSPNCKSPMAVWSMKLSVIEL